MLLLIAAKRPLAQHRPPTDRPVHQQRNALVTPPFDVDVSSRHPAMVEVPSVLVMLDGRVEIEARYLTKSVDERLAGRRGVRRRRCRADEIAQRPPCMRVTARTPLPVHDVEPIIEQAPARFVRPMPTGRTLQHRPVLRDDIERARILGTVVCREPVSVESLQTHQRTLSEPADGLRDDHLCSRRLPSTSELDKQCGFDVEERQHAMMSTDGAR